MPQRKVHCQWCSRDDVLVTPKGALAPHLDGGGKRCVGIGIAIYPSTLTKPSEDRQTKRIKRRWQREALKAGKP